MSITSGMVFVDKSFDAMLTEIGPVYCSITDAAVYEGVNAVLFYQDKRHSDIIRLNALQDREVIARVLLTNEEDGLISLMSFLVENAFGRGYDWQPDSWVQVRHFFGEKGFVYQVLDEGCGFDPAKLVVAQSFDELKKGQDYTNYGNASKRLLQPEIEATIDSTVGLGTTVTVMYKYLN